MDTDLIKKIGLVYIGLYLISKIFFDFILQTEKDLTLLTGLILLICAIITYFMLKSQKKKYNPKTLSAIIISEVFNDDNLCMKYDKGIKELLDILENEKGNSMFSMAQYKATEKLRSEFSANVTHELKTPLTSILGHAEMIKAGIAKGDKAKEFAEVIIEDATKQLELISDLIALSKYTDKEAISLELSTFDLKDLVEESISEISNMASVKDVCIIKNIDPVTVTADREKIKILLNNLLSNGIKYNKKGGELKITVYSNLEDAVIRVKDKGIGISKHDSSRIFERFYVADKSRGKNSGTGLGLSIVKHTAIAHDGTIKVKSIIGEGSEFIFTFPKNRKEETIN
ncbi:MAG: HAMP domain-containing sensor histidine kinase [Lagierella massiliensis]|nr:HAMP domain-containing sensor histidine kinase [Lagierella massiliensis]